MKILMLTLTVSKMIYVAFAAESPCPSVFSYEEDAEPNQNHWYGVIYLTSKSSLVGVRLDIRFDRPIILMVSWMGEVTNKSNRKFTILSLREKLLPGPPLQSRFMIKYDRSYGRPELTTIRLNGRKICPPDPDFPGDTPTRNEETMLERPSRRPAIENGYYSGTTTARWQADSHKQHSNKANSTDSKRTQGSTQHTILYNISSNTTRRTTSKPSVSQNSYTTQNLHTATVGHHHQHHKTSSERYVEAQTQASSKRTPAYQSNFNPKPQSQVTRRVTVATTSSSYTTRSTPASSNAFESECGLVDDQVALLLQSAPVPLITNGRQTAQGQWPWHVALYRTTGPESNYICGGTLVSDNIVITAAHCVFSKYESRPVDPSTLVVYLGKYHLNQYSDDSGVQLKQVRLMKVHPDYSTINYAADIAILVLTSPIEYTIYVRPCCIWRSPLQSVEGKTGTVVGWGFDENKQVSQELKMAEMPVVSHNTCVESYRDFFERYASNRTYCAGSRTGVSACNGDSGGGMVFSLGSRWYLRGIVSIAVPRDNKICDPDHYIIFTDVAKYTDWISENTL